MLEPEIRLLLATFSAYNPGNTGGAVSADVAGADLSSYDCENAVMC